MQSATAFEIAGPDAGPYGREPHGLAVDAAGAVWVALETGAVVRLSLT
ncbi:hypothetical protein SAMN05421678_11422 [Actinopolymorpha cephalotaxi]|uniref:Sugar lactone lactonase YvrE n=1 Tax=Actinopolymorpha cephalotaxi TaxID=504797 RepID=A0A1I2YD25_9ACTN|nr:hypothetical protein [Actinopolymorpha cephalotaxi]NYH87042.1 sugar lactone lactonase YvrE [Actinopolymorpha cephalotaxi]SFH23257.1 hypothetical protein SAMN05421678_11422 [Actinopolymorpha cephalotaxi]